MIQFPKIHVRDSVMNAIWNALEDAETIPSLQATPVVPGASTAALGQQIEEGTQPGAPVQQTLDPVQSAAVGETLQGGSPLAGMLTGALG